ncbi:MAG: triose-phosphate isomerase [Chloroflexota bacterium]
MRRVPLVAGNWKMNKTPSQAAALVEAMLPGLQGMRDVERVICPPFVALPTVAERLAGSGVALGAQHMHWEDSGAFTGEVSALMLKELCTYIIVGHSERRAYFGETDETVQRRVRAGLRHGLRLIVCVGETLAENEAGETQAVVRRQVAAALEGVAPEAAGNLLIAYEPVWAIGTGRAATGVDANRVAGEAVRPAIASRLGEAAASAMRVLYGGSLSAANAGEFFMQPEIDGGLVGGASLKPEEFVAIVRAARPS